MNSFGWAIVGPGVIAHQFSEAVHRIDGAHVAMVQGRSMSRAQTFAPTWQRDHAPLMRATDTLDAVLNDDTVRGVYVATPHAFHAETIVRCLEAGKAVLCEKPLVTHARLARSLCDLAKARNTFLMEAVWTRFLPIYTTVHEWLRDGKIGAARAMQSSFCFNAPFNPGSRLFDLSQAGGALLDIGIYNLTVTRWVLQSLLGQCPRVDAIDAHATLGSTGVDHRVSALLKFPDGVSSHFFCALDAHAENAFHIWGEAGHVTIHAPFWAATRATLVQSNSMPVERTQPFRINGFEYEIVEAMRCINAGHLESQIVPHVETIATLEWMDQIRRDIGVVYPFAEHA
jgi:predicted dehydrogenase